MSMFNHELVEENSNILAGAVFFIGLKTLEQVESLVEPEKKLSEICFILNVQ